MRTIWMLNVLCIASLMAGHASAQRRPIGAEQNPKAVVADEVDDAAAQAKAEADKKKAAEAKVKKQEQEAAQILAEEQKREAAEQAARRAAEEKKQKQLAAEAKKKADAEAKKNAAAEQRLSAQLKAARSERVLVRQGGSINVRIALRPGAPEIKAVEEIRLDIAEVLKVPDPTFGERRPINDAELIATVSFEAAPPQDEPVKKGAKAKKKASALTVPEPIVYRVHKLRDAGVYGFHATLPVAGSYKVVLSGKDGKDNDIEHSFNLHPGVWPPPDWDQEQSSAKQSSGRRRPLGLD